MKAAFVSRLASQLAPLQTYWAARSRRERQLLIAAGVVILVAVLWTMHDSVTRERQRLQRVIPVASAQLKSMQEQAAELTRLGNLPRLQKLDATRQVEDIQSAAKVHGLSVQVRQDSGRLTVSGDAAQFNTLVTFLGAVQSTLGMRSEMLDVARIASGVHFELRLAPLN